MKYLTNPVKYWSNEHKIYVDAYLDDYAIVFYEALLPVAAVIFAKERLAGVGGRLLRSTTTRTRRCS